MEILRNKLQNAACEIWETSVIPNKAVGLRISIPNKPLLTKSVEINPTSANVGNGTMVALAVGSRENVDKIHAKAIALGGKDEGAPGERSSAFYGGYFRDLDGNKLVAFHMG